MATKKPPGPKATVGESVKGAHQPVDALVHKGEERLFIPSREEAGQEEDAVAGRPHILAVPLNPVTTRGQDPELYWLHKYGSNWQMRQNDRNVKDGSDDNLSGEPEVIKAFRDTWELGIHSYSSYLRDRLLVARELLSASGSCFVQISDENVHLVRSLMDEVFGSENFVSLIAYKKTTSSSAAILATIYDYIIWYAKDKDQLKYRQLYSEKVAGEAGASQYTWIEFTSGERRNLGSTAFDQDLPTGARRFAHDNITSQRPAQGGDVKEFEFGGKRFNPGRGTFKTDLRGLTQLAKQKRLIGLGSTLRFVRFLDDFPCFPLTSVWDDTVTSGFSEGKVYVVQTHPTAIARCILMTTDPGDLVLDPTCGSGTTAHVAEQWGRRWITSDTSRIALNIAKTRLMTATYPWYRLADVAGEDIHHGFKYKTVPHVTLKSIANGEPPETETLFDQPEVDKKKLRVAGPFTVETLQSFEPLAPEGIAQANTGIVHVQRFADRIFEHLKHAGIKNGSKNETAVFSRVDAINEQMGDGGALHAEGWYDTAAGERKAYFHIGPQFGTVAKKAVNDAILACRRRADADWLVILGFGFESDVDNRNVTLKVGSFEVTKVRMHDDLMQDGLIKKDKKAASFVTIGEPDIAVLGCDGPSPQPSPASGRGGQKGEGAKPAEWVSVEIRGLDLYDPITDEVKPRNAADIAYWMVDDAYDGANFVATQVFFCGGDHDEFDKFKRGLSMLAVASAKAKVERTLKLEIDDEAFERVYGLRSHPIAREPGRRVAVRVISQFGEESTKVLRL